jgi:hypothetical protein
VALDRDAQQLDAAEPASTAAAIAARAPALATLTLARVENGRGAGTLAAASAMQLQRSYGNAAVARAARRILARDALEGEGGERVIRLPAGTQLYKTPDTKAKAGEPTAFEMPVGLIGIEEVREYTDKKKGWFVTRIFWAVNIGGERRYIRYEDVAGVVNATVEADRKQYGPDPTLGNASDGGFRKKLLEELQRWVGGDISSDPRPKAVTETDEKFQALIPDLETTRARNASYTTCIDFLSKTFSNAAAASGVSVDTSVLGSDAKAKAALLGHGLGTKKTTATGRFAWHESTPGMTARPKPGDVYVLYMNNNRDVFSHTGFIVKAPLPAAQADNPYKTLQGKDPAQPQGTELWMTVDGGQGSKKNKAESFEARYRWYNPTTNEIEGEPIQGDISADKRRWLLGWIDIEQVVNLNSASV